MLTYDEILFMVITGIGLAIILSNRLKPDLVAMLLLLSLSFSGLVGSDAALSGFSSSVVIILLGLFIITQALEDTGVIQWIAKRLNRIGRGSEVRLIVLFMAAGATLSLIMNNIAAGAILLPAAVQVGTISQVRLSKLLIPVSFGTLVGGMTTYFTTANIVMSDLLLQQGEQGLNFLDFFFTGGLITLVSLVYMVLIGRHLLPERDSIRQKVVPLEEQYHLDERLWRIRILPNSHLAGKRLAESQIGEKLGLTVLGVWHGKTLIPIPKPAEALSAYDVLAVLGRQERIADLLEWNTERLEEDIDPADLTVDFTEVIIPPRSQYVGQTLTQLNFRRLYGVTAVALWREGWSFRTNVGKRELQVGDALLVTGPAGRILQLAQDTNFIVPSQQARPIRREKAFWALIITAIVLIIAILDLLPLPEVMLAGATAMVLSGCMNMEEAYQAVEWRVIFLVAGLIPVSIAMRDTGLAERLGVGMVDFFANSSDLYLVGGMFLLTVAITQVMGGQVTALVIGPIALQAATQADISPQAMAVTVAIGCSTAFLTPLAHPVNLLMMGTGGYQFGDFFKVGLGMTIVTFVMLLVGMALFWGIY